jgi:outer membrane protein assembly factor BamE (lipoprotein component of BamABCDE complex)
MRIVLPLVSILLCSLTLSCVPIPKKVGTRGKITKPALEFLEEGVTSREQVLLHLGEPDFVGENEQIFVWDWVRAWDIWLVGYGVAVFPDQQCNGLLIQFNDQASVQAVERWDENMAHDEACKFGGQLFLSTNEYTNYVHGFSIQFPPEWRVVKGSSELDASDFPKDWGVRDGAMLINARKAVGSSSVWLSIAAYPIAEELDIWEVKPEPSALPPRQKLMMKLFRSILAPKEPDTIRVNVLDSGRTTVNGSHAIWVKHQIESQDSTLPKISLTYSFVHDRKLFQISGHWDKEHEGDKYKEDIEEVIRSFRFIR